MSRLPRLASDWRAGKIFLYARSPVAPKNTSASARSWLIVRPPSSCAPHGVSNDRAPSTYPSLSRPLRRIHAHEARDQHRQEELPADPLHDGQAPRHVGARDDITVTERGER